MGSPDQDVRKAAKDLRIRLGLSQEIFGQRIGRTLNTVLRYESQIGPKDETLVRYAALAIDSGFIDLAHTFQLALIRGLGSDLVRVLTWKPSQKSAGPKPIPADLAEVVEAFVAFLTIAEQDLEPAEALARASIKQMLLKQHPAVNLLARKSR